MALSFGVFVFWAVSGVCILSVHGNSCPDVLDSLGFDCPRTFDLSDDIYCCNAGQAFQYCCSSYEYYSYAYLSTGAICGVIFGSIILLVLFITSIVACCVCCARAPPRYPVSTHVHTATIGRTTERPATIMTVNAPPGYYTPSAQPPPPPHKAETAPKPGQYRQFQNEPVYPNN